MRKLFTSLLLLGMCSALGHADVLTWTLNNVTFAGGGHATGSFDYDPVTNLYSNVNIQTPHTTYLAPPDHIVTGGAFAASPASLSVQHSAAGMDYEFHLLFAGPGLTAAGGTVAIDIASQPNGWVSRESAFAGPDDYIGHFYNVSGGSVTAPPAAVPEPATGLLLLSMLGAVVGIAKVRRA